MRELVYLVAVSLDGYLAGPNGQFDAFPVEGDHLRQITAEYPDAVPTEIASRLGLDQGAGRFDTVLMGANTYAVGLPAMPSPYRHLDQYVFTRRRYPAAENVTFTNADPGTVVRALKEQAGRDIWLCGGGNLAAQLAGEIDRLVLKRNPVLFGDGIPVFAPTQYAPVPFRLVRSRDFASGVSIVEYAR